MLTRWAAVAGVAAAVDFGVVVEAFPGGVEVASHVVVMAVAAAFRAAVTVVVEVIPAVEAVTHVVEEITRVVG